MRVMQHFPSIKDPRVFRGPSCMHNSRNLLDIRPIEQTQISDGNCHTVHMPTGKLPLVNQLIYGDTILPFY